MRATFKLIDVPEKNKKRMKYLISLERYFRAIIIYLFIYY